MGLETSFQNANSRLEAYLELHAGEDRNSSRVDAALSSLTQSQLAFISELSWYQAWPDFAKSVRPSTLQTAEG